MMHFLGGFSVGLIIYWILFDSGLWGKRAETILIPVLSVLVCLMIIGIGWEIMEYYFDLTDSHEVKYFNDVIHDLIMDASGAIVAAIVGVKNTNG
mgnify:CR=1 FL=1